jgi:hypothetical protein
MRNLMDWISVEDRYPENKQKVKIRVEDTDQKEHILECTFIDHPDFRGWRMKPPENVTIHAKPTHWMPISITL